MLPSDTPVVGLVQRTAHANSLGMIEAKLPSVVLHTCTGRAADMSVRLRGTSTQPHTFSLSRSGDADEGEPSIRFVAPQARTHPFLLWEVGSLRVEQSVHKRLER